MTVDNWVSSWISLRSCALAARTVAGYRDLHARYIAPALGALPLAALRAEDVQKVLASICADGHSRTAQLVLVLLRASLRAAVRAGYLASDPCALLLRPRHIRADPRFMSRDDMRRFAAACISLPWGHAWLLAMLCGLRRGELAGLRWQDVDIPARVLHIRNQRQRLSSGVIDCPPKSAAGKRDIPLPPALGRLLLLVHRQYAASLYVVCYQDGRPIDPHSLNTALTADLKKCGLPPINLHGLRHSMASAAVAAGVPIKVLQGILGHASYTTTADIYAHVTAEDTRKAIDTVSQLVL